MTNTWTYRADIASAFDDRDFVGYDVMAADGSIGSIDEHSVDAGSGFVVVDTGFWIFGKKRLIPAGVVTAVDHDAEQVHVTMTKDEIKSAPDYDPAGRDGDDWPRAATGSYYDPFAW